MKDIEKLLNPGAYELKKDEDGVISTIIVDEELDGFSCVFDGADSFEINVEDYQWITLSDRTLRKMLNLIKEAKKMEDEQ